MSANNIRTDFARPNRSLPLLLQTASTNLFLIMLLHLLHGILAVEAKCFNFFVSEKFEFLRVFGEIEPFHEFDAHAVEAGTWEVVRPPNINTLVYHPEESARQFDEIGQVIVWKILVNLSNKVAAASLNAPDMRSVLNYLDHLGKQRFLNQLYRTPAIGLHGLFQKLQRAHLGPRSVSQKQSQYFSDYAFGFGVLGVLPDRSQQPFAVFYLLELCDFKEVLEVAHQRVVIKLLKPRQTIVHKYIMSGQSQPKGLTLKQLLGTMEIRYSVKEVAIGERLNYAIITTSQNVLVIDLAFKDILHVIRRSAYPRVARFANCQRFFLASFTDNTVFLFDTRAGVPISKIMGVPRGVTNFVLSSDSSHLFYASNNTICLWNNAKSQLQLFSAQWRNINCYAINQIGTQIALGTYGGAILILSILSQNRVSEMQLKKHKSCVMCIAFSKNKVFSVSYDRIFLTTTIHTAENGSKQISYLQLYLQAVPRGIQSISGVPHFLQNQGLFWIVQGNKMRGYTEGLYSVCQQRQKQIVYILCYYSGKLQWFIR